ncbi:MAG: type II toxin-antitoxin system PemK/MazF family toxin [Eubacteriales bacterium]|nr:type II toxin-antitoxin system PemK/MazF family toxin [Eubacteriales bacterium]
MASKDTLTAEDVIKNKKAAIRSVNDLLERYIATNDAGYLKKANLISYWLKSYSKYIQFEETFVPSKNIAYKRGDIVKINFGFNIGAEYGGLHYAVVVNITNDHSSPVVTVVPLTSQKGRSIHRYNIDLGNELYRLLKSKHDAISQSLNSEKDSLNETATAVQDIVELAGQVLDSIRTDESDKKKQEEKIALVRSYLASAKKLNDDLQIKKQKNKEAIEDLRKIDAEISKMKSGSIALVSQITTVSKIKIMDPKNSHGILFGIRLNEESMDKINKKMKELFIFQE